MTKARDLANASTALSAVSPTELGYLDGVTSAVQTQLDAKQAANVNVSTTELGYLDGVTSAIQTQIDSKVSTAGGSTITVASGTTVPLTIQNNGTGNSLVVNDETSDTTNLVVDASGNTGIGLSSPTYKLTVKGADGINELFSGATKGIRMSQTSTSSNIEGVDSTGSASYQPLALGGSTLAFTVAGTEKMTLDASGNLGIGKSPSYKLDVNGTVNATALYVGGAPLSTGTWTQAATGTLTGASVNITGLSGKRIAIFLKDFSTVSDGNAKLQVNGLTNYYYYQAGRYSTTSIVLTSYISAAQSENYVGAVIDMAGSTMAYKPVTVQQIWSGSPTYPIGGWVNTGANAITSIQLEGQGGWDAGTYFVYVEN